MTISRLARGKRMSCWDVCNRSSANLKKIFAPRLRDCGREARSAALAIGYWGGAKSEGQRSEVRRQIPEAENVQRPTPNSQRPTERKRKRGKLTSETLTAENGVLVERLRS